MRTATKTIGRITLPEKRRLVRAIAIAGEVAFRRGFHHGFVAAQRRRKETFTEQDVQEWRYSDSRTTGKPSHSEKLYPWCHDPFVGPLGRILHDGPNTGYRRAIREFLHADPEIEEPTISGKMPPHLKEPRPR